MRLKIWLGLRLGDQYFIKLYLKKLLNNNKKLNLELAFILYQTQPGSFDTFVNFPNYYAKWA